MLRLLSSFRSFCPWTLWLKFQTFWTPNCIRRQWPFSMINDSSVDYQNYLHLFDNRKLNVKWGSIKYWSVCSLLMAISKRDVDGWVGKKRIEPFCTKTRWLCYKMKICKQKTHCLPSKGYWWNWWFWCSVDKRYIEKF